MHFPERPADEDANEPTVVLSENDVREAVRLLRVLTEAIDDRPSAGAKGESTGGRHDLILRARAILTSRRQRTQFFSPSMFGEPAWDMLLVLYATEMSEERQSIGRLAEWVQTPLSTAVRWLDYLEKKLLVEREPHPNDKRIIFIKLADKARNLMDAYLGGTPWDPHEAG